MEQFRHRLLALESFNDLKALIRQLAEVELTEPFVLPLFVVRSVLQSIRDEMDDRPETATWDQVRRAMRAPMERVLDALTEEPGVLAERRNELILAWRTTSQDLL